MDKERIKGKAEDVAGRVERQVGEWTGNDKAQAEGLAKQAEGKARNAVGKAKDAVRDAADKLHEKKIENEEDRTIERDKDVAEFLAADATLGASRALLLFCSDGYFAAMVISSPAYQALQPKANLAPHE